MSTCSVHKGLHGAVGHPAELAAGVVAECSPPPGPGALAEGKKEGGPPRGARSGLRGNGGEGVPQLQNGASAGGKELDGHAGENHQFVQMTSGKLGRPPLGEGSKG